MPHRMIGRSRTATRYPCRQDDALSELANISTMITLIITLVYRAGEFGLKPWQYLYARQFTASSPRFRSSAGAGVGRLAASFLRVLVAIRAFPRGRRRVRATDHRRRRGLAASASQQRAPPPHGAARRGQRRQRSQQRSQQCGQQRCQQRTQLAAVSVADEQPKLAQLDNVSEKGRGPAPGVSARVRE